MATFQEMKARYESPEKKGFVGNVLTSMTQPFRRALEAARYAGSAPGGYTPMFKSSSAEDINAAIREPSKQVVKSVLTAGSFLIRGGGGKAVTALGRIGTAAGKGAGAGLLSGYGLSESGKELESTLKGGALGAAVGGALQGIGEGAKALSRAKTAKIGKIGDQEIRSYGIKNDAYNKIQGGSERAKSGVAVLKSEADEIGVPLADRYAKERALKPVIESISNKVDSLSTDMAPQAKTQILANIEDTIRTIPKYNQNMAYERINNILATYGDELSGPELRSLYQEIADAGKVYSTGINVKSNTAEIFSKARDSVRGYFTGEAGKEISKMADIYEIAPFIKRQAGVEWGPNLFGMQFRPVLATKIVDRLGGAITGTPKALLPSQGLAGGIEKITGLGQRAIPGIVGLSGREKIDTSGPIDTSGMNLSPEEMQILQQSVGQQSQQQGFSKEQLTQMVLSGQLSAADAKFLLDMYAGPERDTASIQNVQQAISMIDEYGSQAAGKVPFVTGKVGEFFGVGSKGTEYRSLISSIRTKLIKQIAGTAQTPAEMKNLIDRLPQPTDEPQVARIKLQVLLNDLQGGSSMGASGNELTDQYNSY